MLQFAVWKNPFRQPCWFHVTFTIGRGITNYTMVAIMKENFLELIKAVGEDPTREGLKKTPERAAGAFKFLTYGYHQSIDEIVNGAIFTSDMDEMVLIK